MEMISGEMFSVPSSMRGFVTEPELVIPDPNPNPKPYPKKRRNLPGTPDPDAEVIALSPKSLMATNRFLCEICNKGFQRDQNLQLHRRGHNLPWKLRQRSNKEVVRKKVYVCPEKSCVHNDPSRALGDLTGIKKHFSRKHGEKKWKCDKCSKKYAVQSDWKAHSKTCGTREYKCDCGTLFSRKDSFITHRAFCDALADETARLASVESSNLNFTNEPLIENMSKVAPSSFNHGLPGIPQIGGGIRPNPSGNPHLNPFEMLQMTPPNIFCSMPVVNAHLPSSPHEPESKSAGLSLYRSGGERTNPPGPMSATALLQKAALMGSTMSTPSSTFLPDPSAFNPEALMDCSSGLSSCGNLEQFFTQSDAAMGNSSNRVENGLTRDFLGVGGGGGARQLLPQELAKFASMGPQPWA